MISTLIMVSRTYLDIYPNVPISIALMITRNINKNLKYHHAHPQPIQSIRAL